MPLRIYSLGLAASVILNALLFSVGSDWRVFVTALVFSLLFAVPCSIVIGGPVFLLVAKKLGPQAACIVGGAAAGFVGAMALSGFGLLDPAIVYGHFGDALGSAAKSAALPGIAGLVGGSVMAWLFRVPPTRPSDH